MFRTIAEYEEDGLGLPYSVVLVDAAEEEIDEETGTRIGISIPDLEGLIATLAVARSFVPVQLDGAEVRFLRRALGKSAKELAGDLGVDAATFSRWENGRAAVGEWADKQLRMFIALTFPEQVSELGFESTDIIEFRVLKREEGRWPRFRVMRVHKEGNRLPEHDAWQTVKMAA
jgi:transcriptional regulator with XRE-family HTH domain